MSIISYVGYTILCEVPWGPRALREGSDDEGEGEGKVEGMFEGYPAKDLLVPDIVPVYIAVEVTGLRASNSC